MAGTSSAGSPASTPRLIEAGVVAGACEPRTSHETPAVMAAQSTASAASRSHDRRGAATGRRGAFVYIGGDEVGPVADRRTHGSIGQLAEARYGKLACSALSLATQSLSDVLATTESATSMTSSSRARPLSIAKFATVAVS